MTQIPLDQALRIAIQHHQAGRLHDAESIYRQVLAADPNNPVALHHLGLLAYMMRQYEPAIDLISRSIAANARLSDAHSNLANVFKSMGRMDDAVAAYRNALALDPGCAEAIHNMATVFMEQGLLDDAIDAYRRACAARPESAVIHSSFLLALHYHPQCTAELLRQELAIWSQRHADPLAGGIQPCANDRSGDRPLRIGYISADFRKHVVGQNILPLLREHDRSQYEVVCYADLLVEDQFTAVLRKHADVWRSIQGLNDERIAALVREDRIDILVDLSLHSGYNHLLAFARKPAPVQITYLAYCGSSGMKTMDYRLTDRYLDPPEMGESYYTEQSIRLPRTYWCYTPFDSMPDVNPLPARGDGRVTFGCMNNFCKVSSLAWQTWVELLRRVPGSRLIVHCPPGSHRGRLYQSLADAGIDASRLALVPRTDEHRYFQMYHQIDIALDPFPYTGGITSCDALWMGVPVVTLAGQLGHTRGGVSILSNVGLPGLIARGPEEYIQIAAALSQNLAALAHLRSTLRQTMRQSPLMNGRQFTRDIETVYRSVWRRWCGSASSS